MQSATPPSPDPIKLAAAIEDLDRDYDKIESTYSLEAATVDRREQFLDAVGDHDEASVLDGHLKAGRTSRVLELARKILKEIAPTSQPTPPAA